MNLDDLVPVADHVTRQSRVVEAPRRVVWEELQGLKLRSLPISLLLGAVRAVPVLLTGRWRGHLDRRFLDVVPIPELSSEPPTAVVFGGVLQAWRLTGGELYAPRYGGNGPAVRRPLLRRWDMQKRIDELWLVSERETGVILDVASAAR